MNQTIGWVLAVLAIAVGYAGYGWRGVVLGVTVIVFVLLLQFSRTLRVLRGAAQSPVGHVPSAVMLNSKLQRGLRMADVIALTRSLGTQVAEQPCAAPGGRLPRGGPELWAWRDDGGSVRPRRHSHTPNSSTSRTISAFMPCAPAALRARSASPRSPAAAAPRRR